MVVTTKRPSLFSDIPGEWRGRTLTAWLRIKDCNYYYNHTWYPYRRCCFHVNSSPPRKCSPWSQDRLQYSGVEDYNTSEVKKNAKYIRVYVVYVFFQGCLFSMPFFSLPPSRNSDPGSHNRLFTSLSATVRGLHFYREKISAII